MAWRRFTLFAVIAGCERDTTHIDFREILRSAIVYGFPLASGFIHPERDRELDDMIGMGWGNTPQTEIPANWRTRRGPELEAEGKKGFRQTVFFPQVRLAAAPRPALILSHRSIIALERGSESLWLAQTDVTTKNATK